MRPGLSLQSRAALGTGEWLDEPGAPEVSGEWNTLNVSSNSVSRVFTGCSSGGPGPARVEGALAQGCILPRLGGAAAKPDPRDVPGAQRPVCGPERRRNVSTPACVTAPLRPGDRSAARFAQAQRQGRKPGFDAAPERPLLFRLPPGFFPSGVF